ncbi:MAG: pilus assembly protein [Xanthobacteraceae bacterium]|nr:pilus assembly protein [Xanthobacteraceae bacterium]PWB60968.1 MAG: pilus assembly protein TadG [Bradyrhizobiaceae bacterium]
MTRSGISFALRARRLLQVRTVRRLARREDGAAAVEFGFVALPFFALLFAIIETSLVFLAGQSLETAAADSARLVLTGQAQSIPLSDFKTKACSKLKALFDCEANLRVDVRTYASFDAAAAGNGTSLIDPNTGKLIEDFVYQPGAASQIVVVRLIYPFPVLASQLLSFSLSDMADNKRLLVATVAFRNEPFGS